MRLTLSVLYHHLSKKYPGMIEVSGDDSAGRIERVRLWDGGSPQDGLAYIASWEQIRCRDATPPHVICLGGGEDAAEYLQAAGGNALVVAQSAAPVEVFQDVCDIFYFYDGWERELNQAIIREDDLTDILDIVSRVFDNPVFMVDAALRVIGSSTVGEDTNDESYWMGTLSGGISNPEVMSMMAAAGLVERLNTSEKTVFVDLPPVEPFFSANFMKDGRRVASLTVIGDRSALDRRLLPIIDAIRDMLQTVVFKAGSPYYYQSTNLLKMVLDMLGGAILDKRVLQHNLTTVRWNISDEYQVIKVELDEVAVSGGTGKYTQELVKTLFPDSILVDFQDAFIVILHRTGHRDVEAVIDTSFKKLLAGRKCKAGVSMRYFDFSLLTSAYTLSGVALEKGGILERSKHVYHYEDYFVAHVIDLCAVSIDIVSLCHPEAIKLYQYDATHKSDLLDSLYIYLDAEKHLAAAAEKLNIHRNTLVYRLSRIQDLCRIDLNSGAVRTQLMWSYQILRHLHPKPAGEDGQLVWTGYE